MSDRKDVITQAVEVTRQCFEQDHAWWYGPFGRVTNTGRVQDPPLPSGPGIQMERHPQGHHSNCLACQEHLALKHLAGETARANQKDPAAWRVGNVSSLILMDESGTVIICKVWIVALLQQLNNGKIRVKQETVYFEEE